MTLQDFALDYTKQFDPNSRALITDFVDQWEEYRKDNLTIEGFKDAIEETQLDMPYLGQGNTDDH